MIYSMTGFGSTTCKTANMEVRIEAKSVNSKSADIKIKLPSFMREYELIVKNIAQEKLQRGKIDINIEASYTAAYPIAINTAVAKGYEQILEQLSAITNSEITNKAELLLKFPDIIQNNNQSLSDKDWLLIEENITTCLDRLNLFRKNEGLQLHKDFTTRIQLITNYKNEVEALLPFRKQTVIEKIRKAILELQDVAADENRFEQELIYYLEKIDITEELVRLKSHLSYFNEVLENESNQGRKLGFISQEIGREINTIGSKANNLEIQQLVVKMKDELEKIKEQLLNVL